jgi:D-aminopeptidase
MTSGDDKLCAEAKAFLPETVTCQVKKALTLFGAEMLSPQKAHEAITAKTIEAVSKIQSIPLPEVKSPAILKRELVERGTLPSAKRNGIRLIDGRTYEISCDTLEEALLN